MSSAIDKAKAHFKSVLDKGLLGPIDVPEWELEVYYRPTISLAQQSEMIKLNQEGKQTEALVVMLIARALDGEGKPIFKKMDKTELMRAADPAVMLRIIEEINANSTDAEEFPLGN